MYYRTAQIMALTTMPAVAGTWIEPIRVKDPISALQFNLQVTVGAGIRLEHLLEAFTRIDIVDGSDVLMSLTGGQLDGLQFFDTGKLGSEQCMNIRSVTDVGRPSIFFGRYLWDELLALDPSKFENLQIRITYNGALVEAAATAVLIGIMAEVFDEKVISPVGFLQNREFHRYVPAAGVFQTINLPTDLVLRKLIVQPYEVGRVAILNMQAVRLDEDNLKRIVFDIPTREFITYNSQYFGKLFQPFVNTVQSALANMYGAPGLSDTVQVVNNTGALAVQVNTMAAGLYFFTTVSGTDLLFGEVGGVSPYQMLCYAFGKQDNIDDWYDPTRVGDLRLRIQGGTVAAVAPTTRTILQQLRRY